ncbi:hypothetical protein FA13DRAFT_1696394 [Coprinellus micaceus]|uniref:H-type lectin domain-containing protein n=1 Tax=Coprinellus micaceus TaxID=71717 RepID=A0A4Y7SGR0_COPMI|nr:hypothetical protein FA13DRAFT_1696394 [Coprinellus micaceus]
MVAVGKHPRWHRVGSISDLRQLKPVTGFVSGSLRNEVTPSFVSRLTLPLRASVYGTLTSEGTTFRGFEEPWLVDTENVGGRLEVLVVSEAGEGLADSARADDKVKVAIGRFKTDHDWTQVRKGDRYSTAVTFQQPFENAPPIILGFNKLDMGKHESALRLRLFPQNVVKDSFICNAEAWGETYLYNVFVNWMAIAEPRWQTGVLKTIANNPSALLDNRVDFEKPFSSPPMVFVCFSGLDMVNQWDFRAQATNIDHTGFSISLIASSATWVGVARVSWIAIPGEDVLTRKNTWIGRFSTTAESAVHNGSGEWTGSVKFGFQFKATPKIFIGVDQLAFSHDRNLRLYTDTRNVSKTGMDWRIKQWGNSVLKGAGVSYLALDCA